jgi:light-regulated signal transduction histidine kinase (bacteriophytochrome)
VAFVQALRRKRAEDQIKGLNEALRQRARDLELANKELEAFSYSVSHDLRAPLRSIDGFSQAVLEDSGPALDASGKGYLLRMRGAAQHMGALIDDLLTLSHVGRSEMRVRRVDLSALACQIADEFQAQTPQRDVQFVLQPGLTAEGDERLLCLALQNLLDNAWKFTSRHETAHIEFGTTQAGGQQVYYVRDDGAGFDMAYADKLFVPFQRLHSPEEFGGTGIGLATAKRIIRRHGGRIWAEGAVEEGATFYFTLQPQEDGAT